MCERERKRERGCVRERECVCACVRVRACECACVSVSVSVSVSTSVCACVWPSKHGQCCPSCPHLQRTALGAVSVGVTWGTRGPMVDSAQRVSRVLTRLSTEIPTARAAQHVRTRLQGAAKLQCASATPDSRGLTEERVMRAQRASTRSGRRRLRGLRGKDVLRFSG